MASDSEIKVQITAAVDDFLKGVKDASVGANDFTEGLNKAAAAAAKFNPVAFQGITEDLNKGDIGVREFAEGLKTMQSAAQQAAASARALPAAIEETGEAAHVSSAGMRELIVVGRELASGNLTRLPGSLSILATRLGGIPPQAILAAAAIAGIGYAIYEAIESSEKFQSELDTIQNSMTAAGRGGDFDKSAIEDYITALQQIPGVSRDMAASIANDFARTRNIGTEAIQGLIGEVYPFAELIGTDVPHAAKSMAQAFDDPAKALEILRERNVNLTAAQEEEVRQLIAVGDKAGAAKAIFDDLSVSMGKMVATTTGVDSAWHNMMLSISGVNEGLEKQQQALADVAKAEIEAGDRGRAYIAQALMLVTEFTSATRNLPKIEIPTAASVGAEDARKAAQLTITPSQGQIDKAKTAREENDAVKDGLSLYEKGNSALKEKEQHEDEILRLQNDLNAAVAVGNGDAAQKIQAQIEQEDKLYAAKVKRNNRPEDRADLAGDKGEAEAADARIKTEQMVVEEKIKLGEMSSADALKQLNELAAQEHSINLRRIADMRAVYARQGDQSGVANQDAQQLVEDQRYEQQKIQIDQRIREQEEQTGAARIAEEEKVGAAKIKTAEDVVKQQAQLGQISADQEFAELSALVGQELTLEEQKFARLAQLYQGDADKQAQIDAEKLEAEQAAKQKELTLEQQLQKKKDELLKKEEAEQKQLAQSIVSSFQQSATRVISGQESMRQGLASIGNSIANDFFTRVVEKRVTDWLAGTTVIKEIETAAQAVLSAIGIETGDEQQQSTSKSTSAQIDDYAALGAAAAAAAAASGGPAAAAAAGAATFGIIEGFQVAEVASAAGGMMVDSDQLAMVHENERILPARYSAGLDAMVGNAAQGGSGGGGASITNHFHIAAGTDDLARKIPGMVDNHLQRQMRNGAYGGMRR